MADKIGTTGASSPDYGYINKALEQKEKKKKEAGKVSAGLSVGGKVGVKVSAEERARIEKALAKLPSLSKGSTGKQANGGLSFDTGRGGLLMAPANQPDPIAAELMLMKLQSKIGNQEAKNAEHDIRYRGEKQKNIQIKRMDQRQKMIAEQNKASVLRTVGQVFGWIGVALSAVAAVLIGVFISPAAAVPLVVAAIATASIMILEQSGAIDELMKDASPEAKQGVSYGLMALMLIINIGAAITSGGLSLAPTLAEKGAEAAIGAVEVAADATELTTEVGTATAELAAESASTAGEVATDAMESGIEASETAFQTVGKTTEEVTEEAVEEGGDAAAEGMAKAATKNAEKLAERAAGPGKLRKVLNALVKSPIQRTKGSSIVRLGMVAMRASNAVQGTVSLASAGVSAGATGYTYKAAMERALSKEDLAEITKLIAMDSESRDRIQEVINNIDRGFVNVMQQISTHDSTSMKVISRISKA